METEKNTEDLGAKEPLCVCPFCGSYQIDPEGGLAQDVKTEQPYTFPVCDNCGASAPSIEAWNKRTVTTHMRKQINHFAGVDVVVGLEVAMRSICDLATDKEMAELVGVVTTAEYDELMATEGWETEIGRWTNLKNGYWEHKRTADF